MLLRVDHGRHGTLSKRQRVKGINAQGSVEVQERKAGLSIDIDPGGWKLSTLWFKGNPKSERDGSKPYIS